MNIFSAEMPLSRPNSALVSPGYRAGYEAALAEAERAVESLPVTTELPGLETELS